MDDELASMDLDLAPNEASGLLPVADRPLLETHGWTRGSGWCWTRGGGRLGDRRAGDLGAERVREFPDLSAIEGIAIDGHGRTFYVSDEDEGVVVRHTRLIAAG